MNERRMNESRMRALCCAPNHRQFGALHNHQHWICDKKGKKCMGNHIMAAHPDMIMSNKKPIDWMRFGSSLETQLWIWKRQWWTHWHLLSAFFQNVKL